MGRKAVVIKDTHCQECGGEVHNHKRQLCQSCYRRWYYVTSQDKAMEAQRIRLYREQNPARSALSALKHKANREGRDFDLSLEWIEQKFATGVCEVTGLALVISEYKPGKPGSRGPWSPSFDRIDNSLGYTEDNCRLVCWMYNVAKNSYTDEDVMRMAQNLLANWTITPTAISY